MLKAFGVTLLLGDDPDTIARGRAEEPKERGLLPLTEPLRMGYVGCGFLAQKVHIPNIATLAEFELLALAEVREELGRRVCERYRVPRFYRSHVELADDPEIEAVGISGHFCGQGEIAIDLLRAGKHVLMEKPMAVSISQAERIVAAERESGTRLMVAYMKRYDSGNLVVKSLLDNPATHADLGRIVFVRAHDFGGDWIAGLDTPFEVSDQPLPPAPECDFPAWLPDALGSNYLSYLQEYTHLVNLVRWFVGVEEVEVRAVDLDPADGYTGAALIAVAGVRMSLESASIAYHGWDEHVQIYFERGWIRTSAAPLLLRNAPVQVEVYRYEDGCGRLETITPSDWRWSYKEEMRHFAKCLREGSPFRTPAVDAFHDVVALEKIYRWIVENQAPGAAGREPA
jgi:predicted dehydrogenase